MTLTGFCVVAASLCLPLCAQQYSFEAISVQGAYTRATAITNSGVVVGGVRPTPAGDFPFWRSSTGEMHFPVAPPQFYYWELLGINNFGDVVGSYYVVNAISYVDGYGFVIRDGTPSTIGLSDVPFHPRTSVAAINENGDLVGDYINSTLGHVGFVKVGSAVTTLQFPGAATTSAYGIAWDRTIVGCFNRPNSGGLFNAFLRGPKGNYLELKIAGADGVCAMGINNAAHKIVGFAQFHKTGIQPNYRGFVWDYSSVSAP